MKPISALKIILFALSLGILAACEKAAYDDEESIKKDDTHIIEGDDDENSDQQDNGGTGGSSTDTTNFTDYPEDTTYQDHTTPIIDPNVEDGNDKGSKGSEKDTLSVEQFLNAENLSGTYVRGYIVASCTKSLKYAEFEPPFNNNQALLLADKKTERRPDHLMSIQLKSNTDIRKQLNLVDHPELLHRKILVYGYRSTYLGIYGMKDIGKTFWIYK